MASFGAPSKPRVRCSDSRHSSLMFELHFNMETIAKQRTYLRHVFAICIFAISCVGSIHRLC